MGVRTSDEKIVVGVETIIESKFKRYTFFTNDTQAEFKIIKHA